MHFTSFTRSKFRIRNDMCCFLSSHIQRLQNLCVLHIERIIHHHQHQQHHPVVCSCRQFERARHDTMRDYKRFICRFYLLNSFSVRYSNPEMEHERHGTSVANRPSLFAAAAFSIFLEKERKEGKKEQNCI